MFKTLISKFTFFFWLLFLLVTIPIYIFGNFHFKDILKTSEEEKITLTVNILKPIIAFNLSFNQQEQLHEVLNGMFIYDDIQMIELSSPHGLELFFKSRQNDKPKKTCQYKTTILDPFNKIDIATITITYSNQHLLDLNNKIFIILFFLFIFALIIFSIFFFYMLNDLIALRIIANSLQEYSQTKKIKPIIQPSKNKEIQTVTNVANQMFFNLAQYVEQLRSFNSELEKRVKEEILKQQNQEKLMIYQSRQAAMGEMIESIAHQWRQPLNIIGLATASLETEYALETLNERDFHKKIDIIVSNITYMSDTIDDFRNFLNPDREMNTFNPQKSIQDVLTILDAQFQNKKITSILNTECSLLFYGIENEFKQVMFILFNNAKDAIKKQIEEGIIEQGNIIVSFSCKDNQGIIEVSDNGGGIEIDVIDSIFDLYFSTKFHAQGTGIGLYIAKNIIELRMKGLLSVKNIESGSCFTITLPLIEEMYR